MLVVVGEDPTTSQYASTFLFGAAVAALGLLAAVAARAGGRRVKRDRAGAVAVVGPAYDAA